MAANGEPAREKSGPQKAMERLGLKRDIDLALHLPMRYEDETRIEPIAAAREGETIQVEGTVRDCRVELRSRRQLVVRVADASGELVLRFLNFYPSTQKALAAGQRVRVRGEVRGGFLGREMVHPAFKPVIEGAPLPQALTPVYPTSAQLPQAYLRKAIASAVQRAPLDELLPPDALPPGLPLLKQAVRLLHEPPPQMPLAALEDRSHPAWQRLKFDELLAQQLAQAEAQHERALLRFARPRLAALRRGRSTARRAPARGDQPVIQRAYCLSDAADLVDQRCAVRQSVKLRHSVQRGRTLGQAVSLAVCHHLQPVFDDAQPVIAVPQQRGIFTGDDAGDGQRVERGAGTAQSQRGVAPAVDQLMRLGEEFDLADAAAPRA